MLSLCHPPPPPFFLLPKAHSLFPFSFSLKCFSVNKMGGRENKQTNGSGGREEKRESVLSGLIFPLWLYEPAERPQDWFVCPPTVATPAACKMGKPVLVFTWIFQWLIFMTANDASYSFWIVLPRTVLWTMNCLVSSVFFKFTPAFSPWKLPGIGPAAAR